MFRKSLLASALSLALLPDVAGALGLGGIGTHSALNEPFVGHIELLDVASDELDTVKVLLASEEEFAKVGTQRTFLLTKLRFQPRVSSKGRAVIQISSTVPIREPFLDFLVDVNWPKGRLVKEYTVLLDPPVISGRLSPRHSARARSVRVPSTVDTFAFPMRYGPVEQGTNLWRIARDMAPAAGATVAQTAMALYRNNQDAFIHRNINKLKVDEKLEIPTAAELFALDAREASREFSTAVRGGHVTTTPLTDITGAFEPGDRLEIVGAANRADGPQSVADLVSRPTQDQTPTPEAADQVGATAMSAQAPATQLPGQTGGVPVSGETEPMLGSIQEDLLLVQEAGESTRQETEELRSRIRELEGQLVDIQRLLELSNERFATLQQSKSEQLEETWAEATEETWMEATDEPPSEVQGLRESGEAEPEGTTEAPVPAVESASPHERLPSLDDSVGKSGSEATSSPERSFWESIPQPLLVAVPSLGLLLLLTAWMVSRRRKKLEDFSMSGDLAPETPGTAPADSTAAADAGENPFAEQVSPRESADLKEPSAFSEYGNLGDETEESDVLSEADIYIAYGRYREAEALLEKEIQRSPSRIDVKYKLAEAYQGSGNRQQLEALLHQMQQDGDDRINPDQWRRLSGMLEKSKGGTEQLRPIAAADPGRGPVSAGVEPALQSEADLPSPTGSDKTDLFADDLSLDVENLELAGAKLATPTGEEAPAAKGMASEMELELEDLEDLKGRSTSAASASPSPLEPISVDLLSEISDDSQLDSFDISPFDIDSLDSGTASPQLQEESGSWDEIATKIDLARAYLEMEDPEAARIILEEVAQEGNESQRAEAKELLERMD